MFVVFPPSYDIGTRNCIGSTPFICEGELEADMVAMNRKVDQNSPLKRYLHLNGLVLYRKVGSSSRIRPKEGLSAPLLRPS